MMAGLLDQVIGLLDDPKKRAALDAMLGAIPQKQQNVSRGIRRGIAEGVAFPREYMNTYQPGSMAADNPAATEWAAGTAMNMVGAPALTGGVPGLGSGVSRGVGSGMRKYPAELPPIYSDSDFAARGGRVFTVAPDDFLARVRKLDVDDISSENIADLRRHVERGGKLDPAVVYVENGQIIGHDGRHRALMAKEMGMQDFPVIVIDKAQAAAPEFMQLAPEAAKPRR
jgi:hypothetical protein